VAWPGEPPEDLESLAAVPGQPGRWATLTAQGAGTIFSVSGGTAVVERTFAVPAGTSGIEGLALTRTGATTIAVWATRGSPSTPAKVRAATFDPSTGAFGAVAMGEVTVPHPTADVRHVSDLTLVGTRLIASSASDPGPAGPFESALYRLGTVGLSGGQAVLTLSTPQSLGSFPGHKIEGIACSGTVGLLATDDEDQGGWIRGASFCT
jgi:hypothetical protein